MRLIFFLSFLYGAFAMDLGLVRKEITVHENERVYLVNEAPKDSAFHLLIFLHGLEYEGKVSDKTYETFAKIDSLAKQSQCLAIFPIGLSHIFTKNKEALAWSPDTEEANLAFLLELINIYRQNPNLKKVFLTGFSNGAFFITDLLQKAKCDAFDGFWIQGGGSWKNTSIEPKKIVIEIGQKDEWHYQKVQEIKKQFENWICHGNALYRELSGGHALDLGFFDENLKFLTAP